MKIRKKIGKTEGEGDAGAKARKVSERMRARCGRRRKKRA